MSDLHVDEMLLAYLEDDFPAADRERVDRHLALCAECRGIGEELERGRAFALKIPQRSLPKAREREILARLADAATTTTTHRPSRGMLLSAWAMLAAAALIWCAPLFLPESFLPGSEVQVSVASGEPTAWERWTLSACRDDIPATVECADASEIEVFLREQAGLELKLAGAADAVQFRGACVLPGTQAVAAVLFSVDQNPAWLFVRGRADSSESSAPRCAETIALRPGRDASEDHEAAPQLLTWSRDGREYALVSGTVSGAAGSHSCLLCHSSAECRHAIEDSWPLL